MGAPVQGFDKDAVAEALGVPPHWRIVAGIAVGVRGDPAEVSERDQEREHRVRSRKPLAEIAYGDAWGVPWDGCPASAGLTAARISGSAHARPHAAIRARISRPSSHCPIRSATGRSQAGRTE